MPKRWTMGNYGVYNNLTPKEIRQHARNDIQWRPFVKVMALIMLVSFVCGVINGATSIPVSNGVVKGILMVVNFAVAIGTIVFSVYADAGVVQLSLDMMRNKPLQGIFGAKDRAWYLFFTELLTGLLLIATLIIPDGLMIAGMIIDKGAVSMVLILLGLILIFVVAFLVSLTYGMSGFICIEGKDPVAAMSTSRKMMKGHKARYLFTILPVVGWNLLMSFVLYLLAIFPIVTSIIVAKGISAIGFLIAVILFAITACVFVIPIQIYSAMISAEFYDDLIGNPLNSIVERNSKPARIPCLTAVACLVLSTVLLMLPVMKMTPQEIMNEMNSIAQGLTGQVSPLPDIDTPDDIDVQPNELGEQPEENQNAVDKWGITITPPDGFTEYEAGESGGMRTFFGEDGSGFYVTQSTDTDLSWIPSVYENAQDETIGGFNGVFYSEEGEYSEYSFAFVKDGICYTVTADTREIMEDVVQQIK